MLSDTEFAQLRAVEESTMLELADIVSTVRAKDATGGNTTVESVQEDVPCKRWSRLSGNSEHEFGGKLVAGLTWMMAFPVGTAIKQDDSVVVGTDRFNVVSVLAPETFETARYVVVSKR